MILYLVRHAEPEIAYYSGFPGPDLGATGKEQAIRIGNFLKKKNISQILTSDYIRVLQTVEPYANLTQQKIEKVITLRECEKEIETHEALEERVQNWFQTFLQSQNKNTVIFSHCGPINMILFYLDLNRKILTYPYECKYLCLTPKAGIWELIIENKKLISGNLITECYYNTS